MRARRATCVRSRAYSVLKAAGGHPMKASEVCAALHDISPKYVGNTLSYLKAGGYVKHVSNSIGWYVDDKCRVPRFHRTLTDTAVELVDDCPAGIDEEVIASELVLSVVQVRLLMAGACAAGRVRPLAREHGRWRYLPAPQAQHTGGQP